jgi:hypothetical protein
MEAQSTPYSYVISLGSLCHSAFFLKRLGWKNASYPFDWIFSNLWVIQHCIQDNFQAFLDKQYYVGVEGDKKQQGHSFYFPNGLTMFNHHNPLLESDYQYFVRCVDRFRGVLSSHDERKLFVFIFNPFSNPSYLTDEMRESVLLFNEKLKPYCQNYTLLCVVQNVGNTYQQNVFTTYDNVDFLELTTFTSSTGTEFVNDADNLYFERIVRERYQVHF